MTITGRLRKVYDRGKGPLGFIASVFSVVLFFKFVLVDMWHVHLPRINLSTSDLLSMDVALLSIALYIVFWYAVRTKEKLRTATSSLVLRDHLLKDLQSYRNTLVHGARGGASTAKTRTKEVKSQASPSPTPQSDGQKVVLPEREFIMGPQSDWDYELKVEKGRTLHVAYESESPIDILLVDEWHYSRNDIESPVDFEEETPKGELGVDCEKDEYYVIVLNNLRKRTRVHIRGWLE